MGSCPLRRFEPSWIVDSAGIGQRHDRADRRGRHRQPCPRVGSGQLRICFSKAANSLPQHLTHRQQRSAISARCGWSHKLLDPSGNLSSVVLPTFSPKPRRNPRRLFSTSRSFDCTGLRAVKSARVSCAPIDLQCTGRNQPSRIMRNPARIVAIRLHRHGLERIAYMPRLQQFHREPASCIAANSHCDKVRPPARSDRGRSPSEPNQASRASGSLATLASASVAVCIHDAHARAFQ